MLFLLSSLTLLLNSVNSQNVEARNFCAQYDMDAATCNAQGPPYNCRFIELSTVMTTACVPDNCGNFVNNQTRCEQEDLCEWLDDDLTAVNVSRCYSGNLLFKNP